MSASQLAKKQSRSLYGKIIIAFLLGCGTIMFALHITRSSIGKMLGTVQQLSAPNEKLKLVNALFRDVVRLDQKQRAQSLQDRRKPYNPFLKESVLLQRRLDTLRAFSTGDDRQVKRIDSMQKILRERDKLFLSYLKLRAQLANDNELSEQLQVLNTVIAQNSTQADSNVITTEKKVTTTTIVPIDSMLETPENKEEKKSVWDKLFGRKKTAAPQPLQKLIKEELNIKIDTLATIREDTLIARLGEAVQAIESKRQSGRNILLDRELRLTRAGNMLVSQVLEILQDIESEELLQAEANNAAATNLFNNSIDRMNTIVACFMIGAAFLILLIISDLVRSSRYRTELIVAKDEAENLGMVKQRFLANMSHELRTPLQAIIGFSEQLKQQARPAPEDIEIIHRSSQHLLQIVNEVLDYSRIVSGRFVFNNQPFEMKALLSEVAEIMRLQAQHKGLTFVFETDIAQPLYVTGDAFRIRQVLFNLLGNAIKYTQKGSVQFHATHTAGAATGFRFTVQDTGEGIPEADLERIFLQFEQATTNPNSTGLGLTIVKALTEGMGGTVTAENVTGSGALFTLLLSLPAAVADEPAQTVAGTDQLLPVSGMVWIIDDDPFILRLCTTILDKHRIAYTAFGDPLHAADTMLPAGVTHVMIDIRMPGMSGTELFSVLKEQAAPGTKFIALTAQALPDERGNILDAGFDYLLMKPFMERDFIAALSVGSDTAVNGSHPVGGGQAVDLSTIKRMTGEDEELFRIMLQSFADETRKDVQALDIFVKEADYAGAAECLHRIASRAGQLGNRQLAAAARAAEIQLRNNMPFHKNELQPILTAAEDFAARLTPVHP